VVQGYNFVWVSFYSCCQLTWFSWLDVWSVSVKTACMLNYGHCHCSIPELCKEVSSRWKHRKFSRYWREYHIEAFIAVYSILIDACSSQSVGSFLNCFIIAHVTCLITVNEFIVRVTSALVLCRDMATFSYWIVRDQILLQVTFLSQFQPKLKIFIFRQS